MIFKQLEFTGNQYSISDTGVLKSLKFGKEKIIKIQTSIHGYQCCVLSYDGKKKNFNIHQLVAIAFLNHTPDKLNIVVDHKDDNKLNNKSSNLRLITHAENITKWREDKKSSLLGVYPHKQSGKWISRIKIENKNIHLGLYESDVEASEMFNKAYQNIKLYQGDNESFRQKLNKI